MSEIFNNIPVMAGVVGFVVAALFFGFISFSSTKEGVDVESSKGSKDPGGKAESLSSDKGSAEASGKSKKKKNKKTPSSSSLSSSSSSSSSATAVPSTVVAPEPMTEVSKGGGGVRKVEIEEPVSDVNGKAPTKKSDAAKEKKYAKKAEKKKAAAAARLATTDSAKATSLDTTAVSSMVAPSSVDATDVVFYSKESIDNFEDFEAAAAAAAAAFDSNDGWSTVEISKKSRNKKAQSAPSSATDEQISKIETMPVSPSPPSTVVAAPEPVVASEQPPATDPAVADPPAVEPIREPAPPQIEKQVKIDVKKVGFIIGPKGKTLHSIETAAECTIKVPKTDRESSAPVIVTISGTTAQAAAKGAKAVSDLATKGYSALIQGEGFQENSILVPIKTLPDVIGRYSHIHYISSLVSRYFVTQNVPLKNLCKRNGNVIKKIQDIFSVKINIPDTSNRDGSVTKVRVGIAGMKDQVYLAKDVLKDIIQYSYSTVTHPEITHQELDDVAEESYSLIIGPKGSEIRHIQNSFKVSVHIPNADSFVKKVLIVGKAEAVEKAKAHIYKLIDRAEARQQEYEEQYEARQQRITEDDDPGDIPEELQQYIYKREREPAISPPKVTNPEPSSPFTTPGVVPAPEDQENKNSWARIANLSQGSTGI